MYNTNRISFPDDVFTIENRANYNSLVQRGYSVASDKTILFCGICRDVGEYLERNILRILYTASFFKDFRIFIYENDSSDNTREILLKYKNNKLTFTADRRQDKDYRNLLDQGNDPYHYNRCKVLANCRNEYIDYINNFSGDFDYTCIVDLDLMGGWCYDGFFHSTSVLDSERQNAGVTAYGVLANFDNSKDLEDVHPSRYLMYDCFVFRPFGPDEPVRNVELGAYNRVVVSPGQDPIVVNSNFNGLGLYKTRYLKRHRYDAIMQNSESVDADHVVMHKQIRAMGGRIIMNPSMITSYSHHKYSRIEI